MAVDAVPGLRFVEGLRRAWNAGDAVFPVDPRLPPPARAALVAAMRPGDAVQPGDALVVATSGSTGAPKGVVLTHDALALSTAAVSKRLGVDPATDLWLAGLPLGHIGGLGVVVRAMLSATPLTFDPAAGATLTSMVATQLERQDPGRFRVVLVGGSADWRRRPANVVHTYGLTETGGGIVYDGIALDGVEVRADSEDQLWVRGPTTLRCYRDGIDPKDADGWLPTGDVGAVVDGVVSVFGRADDRIVTGGEKVWPGQVEPILAAHPAVAEAMVVGRLDDEWGQRVVALIVPVDAVRPPALDELRELVRAVLPAWCAPKQLEVVGALPRTASGKRRR